MNNIHISLGIIGVLALSLVVVKTYQLYVVRSVNQKNLGQKITALMKKNQWTQALALAAINQPDVAAQIAQEGIQEFMNQGNKTTIMEKMDKVLLSEMAKLESHIGKLAALANMATLLGLLGTIIGMMNAFAAVAQVNPEEKAKLLAAGISLAMHSTGLGLMIALPTLVAYSVLQNRSNRLLDDANKAGLNIFVQLGEAAKF